MTDDCVLRRSLVIFQPSAVLLHRSDRYVYRRYIHQRLRRIELMRGGRRNSCWRTKRVCGTRQWVESHPHCLLPPFIWELILLNKRVINLHIHLAQWFSSRPNCSEYITNLFASAKRCWKIEAYAETRTKDSTIQ